jgi:hypothetical protein
VSSFADAAFWIDVSQVNGASGAVVQLVLQSSPTRDEAYFGPVAPPVTLSPTTAPIVVRSVRAASTIPLSRFVRWQLQVSIASATWGARFRVRAGLSKQSFFSPTQLAGCMLWLRSDMGITLASGNVSNWSDQSGNGNSATQGTAGSQPPYVTNIMNGAAALKGDGIQYWMQTSAFTLGATATLFAAAQPTVTPQIAGARLIEHHYSQTYMLCTDTTAGTQYKLIVNDGTSPYGTAVGGTVTVDANTIISGTYSSPTGTLFVDGTSAGTGTFTAPTATSLPLAIMQSLNSQFAAYWKGYFAEAIVYNVALGASDMVRVHRYLGARYGVAVP